MQKHALFLYYGFKGKWSLLQPCIVVLRVGWEYHPEIYHVSMEMLHESLIVTGRETLGTICTRQLNCFRIVFSNASIQQVGTN
jgi:hypothetical protein